MKRWLAILLAALLALTMLSAAALAEEGSEPSAPQAAEPEPEPEPEPQPEPKPEPQPETPDPETPASGNDNPPDSPAGGTEGGEGQDGEAAEPSTEATDPQAPQEGENPDPEAPEDAAAPEEGPNDGEGTPPKDSPEEGGDAEPSQEQSPEAPTGDQPEGGEPGKADDPPKPQEASSDVIGPGSSTEDVLRVQGLLVDLGYLQAGQKTGVYDDATTQAVKAFQSDMNAVGASLSVTGLCDSQTLALLTRQAGSGGQPSEEKPDKNGKPGNAGWPGGMPSGFPGKGRMKGMSGFPSSAAGLAGGMAGDAAPEDDVKSGGVPGEALTSSHSSGSKDDTPYGALALDESGVDAGALDIALKTGADADHLAEADYTAVLSGDTLCLDSGESAAARWTFDGLALRTLRQSGVERLILTSGDQSVALDTEGVVRGALYQLLRAGGWTDNTYAYTLTLTEGASSFTARVADAEYILIPAEDGFNLTEEA